MTDDRPKAGMKARAALLRAAGRLAGRFREGLSRISPAQQSEIELLAGLEQLYMMEQAHFEAEGRYFDPRSEPEGLEWPWMAGYTWEYRDTESSFWLVVRADLNEGAIVTSVEDGSVAVRHTPALVPAISDWGLAAMMLSLLTVGARLIRRCQLPPQPRWRAAATV